MQVCIIMQSVFNSNEDVKSDNFDLFVIYLQKRCLKTLQRNNFVQLVTSHRERQKDRQWGTGSYWRWWAITRRRSLFSGRVEAMEARSSEKGGRKGGCILNTTQTVWTSYHCVASLLGHPRRRWTLISLKAWDEATIILSDDSTKCYIKFYICTVQKSFVRRHSVIILALRRMCSGVPSPSCMPMVHKTNLHYSESADKLLERG